MRRLSHLCNEVICKGYGENHAGGLLHELALQLEAIATETLQWLAKEFPVEELVRERLSMMHGVVQSLDEAMLNV